MQLGKIIKISEENVYIGFKTGSSEEGQVIIVPIHELTFKPKLNDSVEVYNHNESVIVRRSGVAVPNWILFMLVSIIPALVVFATLFLLNHQKQDIKAANTDISEQASSTSSTSKTSSISKASSSSTTSSSSKSSEINIIDTTAEELRDMENNGTLKTGQLYRFTAELFRQEDWGDYYGHFSSLNSYYNIKVKASNAAIAGIEIQINKNLTYGWKEGQIVTFIVKIIEDSEKFQYWVVTDAVLSTQNVTEKKEVYSESQVIDTQAIINRDYSSIAGTWKNGQGMEFVFDKNGLVHSGTISKVEVKNGGIIGFNISAGNTGYSMSIYPSGVAMTWVDSDLSKDRLIAGHVPPTNPDEVFYKID